MNVNKVEIKILQGNVVTQTVLGGIAILYLSERVPPRNRPCNCRPVRRAQVQCISLARTHFSTDPTLAEFRGLGIWKSHTTDTDKLTKTWNVLREEDEHRALSNADTKYDALTDIWALKTTQNEFKWQHNTCKQRDVRHFRIALKPVHTVTEQWDCRRKVRTFLRQSHFSATVWTGLYTVK